MSFWEIVLLGVALSMDACAISICRGVVHSGLPIRRQMAAPILFGVFQGVMPLLGFSAGSLFRSLFVKYSGYVVCVILALIGGKMVIDGFRDRGGHEQEEGGKGGWLLVMQAFATSVDAFGVGIGFSAINVGAGYAAVHFNVFTASGIIALLTFACCTLALLLGRIFGARFKRHAQAAGGVVLILLGVKALF